MFVPAAAVAVEVAAAVAVAGAGATLATGFDFASDVGDTTVLAAAAIFFVLSPVEAVHKPESAIQRHPFKKKGIDVIHVAHESVINKIVKNDSTSSPKSLKNPTTNCNCCRAGLDRRGLRCEYTKYALISVGDGLVASNQAVIICLSPDFHLFRFPPLFSIDAEVQCMAVVLQLFSTTTFEELTSIDLFVSCWMVWYSFGVDRLYRI